MEQATFWKRNGKLRPTWRVLIFVGLAVGCYLGLFIISAILLVTLPLIQGRPPLTAILQNLNFNQGSVALIAIVATLLSCLIERRRLTTLGLGFDGRWFLRGSLTGAGMQTVVVLLSLVTAGYAFTWNGSHAAASPWLQYASAMLLTGFAEETLFRGYLLQTLAEGWGRTAALVVTSVLFALAHAANPGFSWQAFIGLILIALLFGYSVFVTGTLWFAIGLHAFWNIFEGVVYGFPNSGMPEPYSLWQALSRGPVLWTGGTFGPEAGLVVVLALVVGFWMLRRQARRATPASSSTAGEAPPATEY